MRGKIYCLWLFALVFTICFSLGSPVAGQETNVPKKDLAQLFEEFKVAQRDPCGKRAGALRIGKNIAADYAGDQMNRQVVLYVKDRIAKIEKEDEECRKNDPEPSLEELYARFATKDKKICGQRDEILQIGREIIERFGNDEIDYDVIAYVRKELPILEKKEKICRRDALYNTSYKTKNWSQFYAVSKQIIVEEGEKPLALDVMLTLVSVGYNLTTVYKTDQFNDDTVKYAKLALAKIGSGLSSGRTWGVFEPFGSKTKAVAWLNYITGYVSYFRLKDKKEALAYFYEAAQCDCNVSFESTVYQGAAIYYFNRNGKIASPFAIREFIEKAETLKNRSPEEISNTSEAAAKKNAVARLYQKLVGLYEAKYSLEKNETVNGLDDYIEKLINRPLPELKFDADGKPVVVAETK